MCKGMRCCFLYKRQKGKIMKKINLIILISALAGVFFPPAIPIRKLKSPGM